MTADLKMKCIKVKEAYLILGKIYDAYGLIRDDGTIISIIITDEFGLTKRFHLDDIYSIFTDVTKSYERTLAISEILE